MTFKADIEQLPCVGAINVPLVVEKDRYLTPLTQILGLHSQASHYSYT